MILGTGGVGKSAIVAQYVQGVFLDSYDPTIEDSYRKQTVIDDRSYTLEILDTAGIEQFTAMRELYIKNSEGFILTYSVTSRASFEELKALRNQVAQIKDNYNVPMILVGNKCDLGKQRQVPVSEAKALAENWNTLFLEVSAKTCTNIDEIFSGLIKQLVRRDSAIGSSFRNSSIYTQSSQESSRLSVKRSMARLRENGGGRLRKLVSVASLKPKASNLRQRASQFFGHSDASVRNSQSVQFDDNFAFPQESPRESPLDTVPVSKLSKYPSVASFMHKRKSRIDDNELENDLERVPEIPVVASSDRKNKCIIM